MALELEGLLSTGVGSVNVITGPMFAGKSRELLEHLRRAGRAGIARCLIRPSMDVRGELPGVALKTHAGEHLQEVDDMPVIRVKNLMDAVCKVPKGCKIIAVDEGQFFPDVSEGCAALASSGALVYVATLNGDFRQKSWPNVAELLASCESVQKLAAWCQCCRRRPAHFTQRLKPVHPGKATEFEVSGDDLYAAVCRACL